MRKVGNICSKSSGDGEGADQRVVLEGAGPVRAQVHLAGHFRVMMEMTRRGTKEVGMITMTNSEHLLCAKHGWKSFTFHLTTTI